MKNHEKTRKNAKTREKTRKNAKKHEKTQTFAKIRKKTRKNAKNRHMSPKIDKPPGNLRATSGRPPGYLRATSGRPPGAPFLNEISCFLVDFREFLRISAHFPKFSRILNFFRHFRALSRISPKFPEFRAFPHTWRDLWEPPGAGRPPGNLWATSAHLRARPGTSGHLNTES